MYFVYVLMSRTYHTRYVGSTENIEKRLSEHNNGKVRYTKGRRPWNLIYKEAFDTRTDVRKRELFLKTGQGRKLLDHTLNNNSGVV